MITQKNLNGFTLTELVAAILIVGIVSAAAIYAFGQTVDRGKVQATIHEARKFNEAAQTFHAYNGRWPNNSLTGEFPTDFSPMLSARDFSRTPPCGGIWDWNGPGTGLPKIGISIRFKKKELPQAICIAIDQEIDDGDLRTGSVDLHYSSTRVFLQFHLDTK